MYDKLSISEIILLTLREKGGKVDIDKLQERIKEFYNSKCTSEVCEKIDPNDKKLIANSLYYLTTVGLVTLEKEKIDSEEVYEIVKKYKDYLLPIVVLYYPYLGRRFVLPPVLPEKFTRRDIKNLILFLERLKENKPSLKIENDIEKLKMLMKTRTLVKLTKEGEEIASKLLTEYKV
ncbi:hypothetical protein YN1551_2285 [Sulfolobus islandicus Y.N.15.51]|uniref:Uncharacterized protein n=1 Tax=Saccharolobus islandicus (strain Y.N.15.51 / Yellowstone \|nr:hypothetical protein [Sulfolobus islandicus]ACP49268.1 hypothetical protein YN1551_2285 [Sulfolobus islandicus Y.N.15.51]